MVSTVVELLGVSRDRKERRRRLLELKKGMSDAQNLVGSNGVDKVLTLSIRGDEFPSKAEIDELVQEMEYNSRLRSIDDGQGKEESKFEMVQALKDSKLWADLAVEAKKGESPRCCTIWMVYTEHGELVKVNYPGNASVSFSVGSWVQSRPSNRQHSSGKHFSVGSSMDVRSIDNEMWSLRGGLTEERKLVAKNCKEVVDRILRSPDSVEIQARGAQCLLERYLVFLSGKNDVKGSSIWIIGRDSMMRERLWCKRCIKAAFIESRDNWGLVKESFAPLEHDSNGEPVCPSDRCTGRKLQLGKAVAGESERQFEFRQKEDWGRGDYSNSDVIPHDEVLRIGFSHLRGETKEIESFSIEGGIEGISIEANEKFRRSFGVGLVIDGRIQITR